MMAYKIKEKNIEKLKIFIEKLANEEKNNTQKKDIDNGKTNNNLFTSK